MAPVVGIKTMRTLYLLRHAKSSWDDQSLADHDRPLASRGVRDAKRMARHLRSLAVEPGLVLCSGAVRTRQTLELIEPSLGGGPVEIDDGLYAASADALLERLRAVPGSVGSVFMVGHNPSLQDVALRLAGAGARRPDLAMKFPTGALATLEVQSGWDGIGDGDAELVDYVVPKQLDPRA